MESFAYESQELVKMTKKIKKLKLATVLILTTNIFLISFNIVLGSALYKNNSDMMQRIRSLEIDNEDISTAFIDRDSKTLGEVEANMKNAKQRIFETVNKKLNENNVQLMQKIYDLESVNASKDIVSVEIINQELNKTIERIEQNVENKERTILETINDKLKETSKEVNEIKERIESDSNKHNISIGAIYDELNKTIHKTDRNVEELELQLHYKKMFSLEQNSYCLDTMHRTKNEHLELYNCHGSGNNQEWQLTIDGELRNRKSCVTFLPLTTEVIIDPCNGSKGQIWKFSASVMRNIEYDICLESKENKIIAAKCNPALTSQIFNTTLLYTIDRFCTFKQGSYVFLNTTDCIIATNGYLLCNGQCLTYDEDGSLSFTVCKDVDVESRKWKYTENGQIANPHADVCVGKEHGKIIVKTCDLNLYSQRWICD